MKVSSRERGVVQTHVNWEEGSCVVFSCTPWCYHTYEGAVFRTEPASLFSLLILLV